MRQKNGLGFWIAPAAALLAVTCTANTSRGQDSKDWDTIWQPKMPEPRTVEVSQLDGLGEDLENRSWQMLATRYHQIHYQPTTDANKVSAVHALIDNLYEFLEGRSPAKARTPIRVFLVPNEWGRSRCSRMGNAMRTGDQADAHFILASLLHEETHLFNFAFLDNMKQGWWAGEFFCIYFQERALWEAQGKDIRQEIASRLPNGPGCHIGEIEIRGKEALDAALSVLYFLEEQYGPAALNRFRYTCLSESKRTDGAPLPVSVFAEVFGRHVDQLQEQWLAFYGWGPAASEALHPARDPRLDTKISYATDKASVQTVVQALANQAGLQYNWTKSSTQTDPLCKRWVKDVGINDRPLHEALREILDPVGLDFRLEEDAIVLYRK